MPLSDPLHSSAANSFQILIDRIEVPSVIEVQRPKVRGAHYRDEAAAQDGKYVVRTMISRPKPRKITVTRGLTDDTSVTDWLDK